MPLILYGGYPVTSGSTFGYASGGTTVAEGAVACRFLLDGLITHVQVGTDGAMPDAVFRVWYDTDIDTADLLLYRGGSAFDAALATTSTRQFPLVTPVAVSAGDAPGLYWPDGSNYKLYYTGSLSSRYAKYSNANKATSGAWDGGYTTVSWHLRAYGKPAEIVTYGDSISMGGSKSGDNQWTSPCDTDWWTSGFRNRSMDLARLVRLGLGLNCSTNLGDGSWTLTNALANWDTRVDAYCEPGTIVVANFGVNDIIGDHDDADVEHALAAHQASWALLAARATNRGYRLVRQSILPVATSFTSGGHDATYWNARVVAFNAAMATWCISNGICNVDCYTPILADRATYLSADYIHPNAAGYAVVANALIAGINSFKSRWVTRAAGMSSLGLGL